MRRVSGTHRPEPRGSPGRCVQPSPSSPLPRARVWRPGSTSLGIGARRADPTPADVDGWCRDNDTGSYSAAPGSDGRVTLASLRRWRGEPGRHCLYRRGGARAPGDRGVTTADRLMFASHAAPLRVSRSVEGAEGAHTGSCAWRPRRGASTTSAAAQHAEQGSSRSSLPEAALLPLRRRHPALMFRGFLALSLVCGHGDTPVTGGSQILGFEEDSIDGSFTVFVRVIRRCLPAPPHRARWPVSLPCSARALPLRPSVLSLH